MVLSGYIRLMRPAQWYKNLLVFLPVLFYPVKQLVEVFQPAYWIQYIPLFFGFAALCAVTSATYIINDIRDFEADSVHPEKRKRPLPSGAVTKESAFYFAIILLVSGLFLAFILYWKFFLIVILYIVTSQLYNSYLRKRAVIDVVTIAVGFVIRAVSGAVLIRIDATSWLVIGVFFFALVLGFGKRKNELQYLGANAAAHKSVFKMYTHTILDHAISMSATWFVIFYTLYCYDISRAAIEQQYIMFTVPIMAGIILRYVYLIHIGSPIGRKPHLAVKDKGILIGGVLLLVTLVWTLFFWGIVMDGLDAVFKVVLDFLENLFPPLFPFPFTS